MAYLKVQYQCGGKEFEYTFYDVFKDEVLIHAQNFKTTPWFMDVALIEDMVAEAHNARFNDPERAPTSFLGSDITVRTMKLG